MTISPALLEALEAQLLEKEHEEDAERLSESFSAFVRAAWHTLKPHEQFIWNWHLDAIAAHLEAVSNGEIHRLQIWVPPGTMKTGMVTLFWHPWEWTRNPWLRYWTASYETRLIQRFASQAQQVMMSAWYQARWGHKFRFTSEAAHYYTNDQGGSRLATSPTSTGTGEHGHRILIDDPIPARAGDVDSGIQKDMKTLIREANEWYDGTVSSRYIDNAEIGFHHARVLVMQRIHEEDLAAHMLEQEPWTVLCLPERFERDHPYAWRGDRVHPGLKLTPEIAEGDPREEGELIWPARRNDHASKVLAAQMTSFRAAGQLQQRPAAREGEILKRHWWRFYDPKLLDDPARMPKFSAIVQSVDTPLKDKESNDLVAIQAWGVLGGDRYLIDLKKGHMNYSQAKRQIREQAKYVREHWRRAAHYCLIENAGYGVELIIDLKREMPGVLKVSPTQDGDKILRAEAASADLESGNCYLPGRRLGSDELSMPDEANCPANVVDFINSCAIFPNGPNDDDVDAWSQCMNWLRSRTIQKSKISSPFHRKS